MNYRILCLFAGVSLVAPLCAQETKIPPLPPLPAGPLLKRTPDFSTWSVTSQGVLMGGGVPVVKEDAKEDAGGTAPSKDGTVAHEKPVIVAQSTVVKTGTTILEQNVDAQGNRQNVWHLNGVRVTKPADAPHAIVVPDFGGGDIQSINFASSDFAGLDWISAKTFTGIKKYQGRDCMIFNDTVSPLTVARQKVEQTDIQLAKMYGQPVPEVAKVPAVAYIDLETRLPLLVTFGGEKRIYQYGTPPTSPLPLPAELAAPVKAYAQKIERLSAPAVRAF